jgi:hypothetical protein
MKFLIALSVLASTSVFAQGMERHHVVKCYDTAQGNDMEVVYKILKKHDHFKLIYPRELQQKLELEEGCLETSYYSPETGSEAFEGRKIRFCREDGQRINGLVPISVEYGQEEDTVYCEKKIWHWLRSDMM